MSNIDNITNKLKEDAKLEIEEILKSYTEEAEVKKAELIGAAERRREDILDRARDRAQRVYERISSNTELKTRDQRIAEEQKLIDRVFELAVKELDSKSDKDFLNDIKNAFSKVKEEDVSILVPENRVEFIKNTDLGKLLDEENVQYGFVIRTPRFDYNYQYDVLIDQFRESEGAEVLKSVLRK